VIDRGGLLEDEAATRRAARGTTGLRLRVDPFEARAELSQNKPAEAIAGTTAHPTEANPALAEEMHRQQAPHS
jgi:transcriptional regulator